VGRRKQRLKPPLTPMMEMLIEAFDPEAPDWKAEFLRAGQQAGYQPGYIRKKLMNNKEIIRRLKYREEYGMDRREHVLEKLIEFWEMVMGGDDEEMKDRLRASQLYGKAVGVFVHRVEADVKVARNLEEKLAEALEDEDGSD
jgi:hypothetical protein